MHGFGPEPFKMWGIDERAGLAHELNLHRVLTTRLMVEAGCVGMLTCSASCGPLAACSVILSPKHVHHAERD